MIEFGCSRTGRRLVSIVLLIAASQNSVTAQWEIASDTLEEAFRAVNFYGSQYGIAVGFGSIYASEDGGLTWAVSDTSSFSNIAFRGAVIDSTVVGPVTVAVGSGLSIVRSADRGVTWRDAYSGSGVNFNEVCSLGNGRFAAFGDGGWLAESSDTGLSWQARLIFPAADMRGSSCLPSGTIWIAGFANNGGINQCCGVLLRSEDSGAQWAKAHELTDTRDGHYYAVTFGSEQVGFALSSVGFLRPSSYLWKTEDGGATWNRIGTHVQINGIDFVDENTGAMVGPAGLILWTEDGGETWVQHPSPSQLDLYDVVLIDSQTAIAVGDIFILRNTTGASVGIQRDDLPGTDIRVLSYPNPARNVVTISVDSENSGRTDLEIRDVLGRIVNVPKTRSSPGSIQAFKVRVEALPSGIYFYSIRSDDQSASGSFVVAR